MRAQGCNVYQTAAYLSLTDGLPAKFEMGECSCPVEFNCKHVVALVLSALAPRPPEQPSRRARESAWERSLESLLDPGASARPGVPPLAKQARDDRRRVPGPLGAVGGG